MGTPQVGAQQDVHPPSQVSHSPPLTIVLSRNEFAFTLQQLLRSLNSKPKVRKLWQFSMKTWRQTIFSGHYHP